MPTSARRAMQATIDALDREIAASVDHTRRLTNIRVELHTQLHAPRATRQCACGAPITRECDLAGAVMCARCETLQMAHAIAGKRGRGLPCQAVQHGDQMLCGHCSLAWDMTDPDPPKCGISKK